MIPLNMWNLEYDTDELFYRNRLTDMKKRLGFVNGKGGKLDWEFGVSRLQATVYSMEQHGPNV